MASSKSAGRRRDRGPTDNPKLAGPDAGLDIGQPRRSAPSEQPQDLPAAVLVPGRPALRGGRQRGPNGAVAGAERARPASPSGGLVGSREAAGGSRGSSLSALLRGCPTSEAGVRSCERSGHREGLNFLPPGALTGCHRTASGSSPRGGLRETGTSTTAGPTGAGTSVGARPEAGKRPKVRGCGGLSSPRLR